MLHLSGTIAGLFPLTGTNSGGGNRETLGYWMSDCSRNGYGRICCYDNVGGA
jgi:hypothetical protein